MTEDAPLPALSDGLAVIEGRDDLIVEGGGVRRVFTGGAARDLLPRLLPLLDGATTAEQAAALLRVPAAHVAQAAAVLGRAGLLRRPTPASLPPGDPAAAFLSRGLPDTDRPRPLDAAEVAVHAAPPLGEQIAADLRATGVARVAVVGATAPPEAAGGADLAIVHDDGGRRLEEAYDAYGPLGVPVLRVGGARDRPEVGPLLLSGATACPVCLRAASPDADGTPLTADGALLACGFAVAEAVALLTGMADPLTGHRVLRPGSDGVAEDRPALVPDPGCATCAVGGRTDEEVLLARLEWLGRQVPWAGAGPPPDRGPRRHSDLATSPRIALADAPLPRGLAALVAACDAGHAVDTYLLGARGLSHPLYRYAPVDGTLIATRADLEGPFLPEGLPPDPDAVLVVVAASGRLTPDHGAGAMRRAHLRAGRAVARATAAAGAAGLHLLLAPTVDERLPELLELYAAREHAAAVIGVHSERRA